MNQNQENQNDIELLPNQRICPNCREVVNYSNKYKQQRAESNNSKCKKCRDFGFDKNDNLPKNQRYCPNRTNNDRCEIVLTYSDSQNCSDAFKKKRLCKSCSWINRHTKFKYHNLENLLSDQLESFYWIGFLLADAWFSDNGQLTLGLAYKDIDHLMKFSKFVNNENSIYIRNFKSQSSDKMLKSCSISLRDKFVVDKIIEKFNIIPPKTYNPPSVEIFKQFSYDQTLSLIIGFIDGDGSFSKPKTNQKHVNLKISCHKCWSVVLQFFATFIGSSTRYKINSDDQAEIANGRFSELKTLKAFCINNNLPILSRKWDRIDLNYLTKYEIKK